MPASITPPETARPARTPVAAPRSLRPARPRPQRRRDQRPARSAGERARRAFDIAASLASLLLLAPLFLLVALAIRLSSPGPVFYRQVRVGLDRRRGERRTHAHRARSTERRHGERRRTRGHGRPFWIYKFRTMVPDAEECGPRWSRKDDSRILPLGRLLRKTRLDETPQFVNVLKGDMSLIGPRPERPYFVDQFVEDIPEYRQRLRVRPGITGRAQVHLDYDSSIDDVKRKLEQDLLYLRRRSLREDLAILARTAWVVLTGKGAC